MNRAASKMTFNADGTSFQVFVPEDVIPVFAEIFDPKGFDSIVRRMSFLHDAMQQEMQGFLDLIRQPGINTLTDLIAHEKQLESAGVRQGESVRPYRQDWLIRRQILGMARMQIFRILFHVSDCGVFSASELVDTNRLGIVFALARIEKET